MKNNKKMPNTTIYEKGLQSKLKEKKAREILNKAGDRYLDLYAGREMYSNHALRKHLEENILPGIALYQSLLDDDETQDRAIELAEIAFRELSLSNRKMIERLGKMPIYYGLMRAMIKRMMRLNFPAEGWDTEWVEVSGKEIAFNMKRCFYLDVLEKYGVVELTILYCRMDDWIYKNSSPFVNWARKKTLGQGDECCDFRFEHVGTNNSS